MHSAGRSEVATTPHEPAWRTVDSPWSPQQSGRMVAMRRLLAILLMLVVPAQFTWTAVASIDGHVHGDVAVLSFHTHDGEHGHHHGAHDHPHDSPAANDEPDGGFEHAAEYRSIESSSQDKSEPDQSGGHYHPILASLVMNAMSALGASPSGGPPDRPPATLTSRIPPLFDWPPSARS